MEAKTFYGQEEVRNVGSTSSSPLYLFLRKNPQNEQVYSSRTKITKVAEKVPIVDHAFPVAIEKDN